MNDKYAVMVVACGLLITIIGAPHTSEDVALPFIGVLSLLALVFFWLGRRD